MSVDKYKELYDLSIKLLLEEQNRFVRIDEKSSLYFNVFTFIIGLSLFFVKWLYNTIIPPRSLMEWFLLILGMFLLTSLVWSWCLLFSVLKVHVVNKIPLTDEMIHFYRDHRLIDIYYVIARGNKNAYEENVRITNRKAGKLAKSYKMMVISVVLVLAFAIAFGVHNWVHKCMR